MICLSGFFGNLIQPEAAFSFILDTICVSVLPLAKCQLPLFCISLLEVSYDNLGMYFDFMIIFFGI